MNARQGFIGQKVERREDGRFLTGKGQYTDDITLQGQTHAYFLRSPYAHARIQRLDTTAAAAAPGVLGIFTGEHFKTVKGYDSYQQKAEIARKGGLDGAVTGFMQAASWGTPDKILRGLEARRELLGDFEMNVAFRFGGTPYEVSERGLKLFAKEVLPVVKSWGPVKAAKAA